MHAHDNIWHCLSHNSHNSTTVVNMYSLDNTKKKPNLLQSAAVKFQLSQYSLLLS